MASLSTFLGNVVATARRFRRAHPETGPVVHIPLASGPPSFVESPPIETTPEPAVATVDFGNVGAITAHTTITIQGTCLVNALGAAYSTAVGSLLGDSLNGLTLYTNSALAQYQSSINDVSLTTLTTTNGDGATTYLMREDQPHYQNQVWTQMTTAQGTADDVCAWNRMVANQQQQWQWQQLQLAQYQQQQHVTYGVPVPAPESAAAEVRARDLLDTVLDPAQRDEMKQHRYFTVIGSTTKRRYRVHVDKGRHGNITEVDARGQPVRRLCCAPTECPESDALVGQKLFLEMSEEEFVRTANVTDLRNGNVVAGAHFIEQGGLLRAG